MSITVEQILTALHTMDPSDVRRVNELAYGILKEKRSSEVRAAKSKLRAGMDVTWKSRDGWPRKGVIVKVNRTRCLVRIPGEYRQWTVPMTMLSAA